MATKRRFERAATLVCAVGAKQVGPMFRVNRADVCRLLCASVCLDANNIVDAQAFKMNVEAERNRGAVIHQRVRVHASNNVWSILIN